MSVWPLDGDEILRRDWNNEEISRADLCRALGVSTETMYKAARRLELASRRKPGRLAGQSPKSARKKPEAHQHDAIGYDYEERRLAENAVHASKELLERLCKFHNVNELVNV